MDTAALQRRVAELEVERDEADRRAGAAERRLADAQERAELSNAWLRQAKRDWGVSENLSFDDLWAEALQLKAAATNPVHQVPDGWQAVCVPDGWTQVIEQLIFHACPHVNEATEAVFMEFRSMLCAAPLLRSAQTYR